MINSITLALILELTLSTCGFQINDAEKELLNEILQAGKATAVAIKQQFHHDCDPIATNTDNFVDFVKRSNMFLDNSLIIPHLLQHSELPRMIIAPDQWGKSVTLNMIKSFLKMRVDQKGNIIDRNSTSSYWLFAHGEIVSVNASVEKLQSPLLIAQFSRFVCENQGQYPVIHLNFRTAIAHNYSEVKKKLTIEIGRGFKQHRYMLNLLSQNTRNNSKSSFRHHKTCEKFSQYLLHDHLRKTEDSLLLLCRLLQRQFNKRVFLLVDDFDAPFFSVLKYANFSKTDYTKTFDLVVDLLGGIFLQKDLNITGIMSGKFPLKLDSKHDWIYHGDYSAAERSQIRQYFGFKKQQVQFLFEHSGMNESLLQLAHQWYDGFDSQMHYHHTASIAQFLKHKQIQSYRKRYWAVEHIQRKIRADSTFRDSILSLIEGKTVDICLQKFQIDRSGKTLICLDPRSVTFSNYILPKDNLQYWFSYLVLEGYLTEISDSKAKIPNDEMITALKHLVNE